MRERPILFSGPMVRAILDGSKTQTRRVMKPQPVISAANSIYIDWKEGTYSPDDAICRLCPYGKAGEQLWVKETWADVNTDSGPALAYRANGLHFCSDDAFPVEYERYPKCNFPMWYGDLLRGEAGHKWRSSRFMPRWASRLTLEVTDVRVQRLKDISLSDIWEEGAPSDLARLDESLATRADETRVTLNNWIALWESINGWGSWDANPWVWAITFKRAADITEQTEATRPPQAPILSKQEASPSPENPSVKTGEEGR